MLEDVPTWIRISYNRLAPIVHGTQEQRRAIVGETLKQQGAFLHVWWDANIRDL